MRRWRCLFVLLIAVSTSRPANADKDLITIAATDWEPFTSATLFDGGLLIELAVGALKRRGYRTRVEIMPWKRALEGTKDGTYDALAGASFTQERTQFLHYPTYHYPGNVSFFARKGRSFEYQRLEDLCPATVGVLRGSFLVDLLKPAACLELELGNDVLTNVKKLAKGRIDFMVETEASVYFHLKQNFRYQIDLLQALTPPFVYDRIYTVISKKRSDYEEVAQDYDIGIKLLESDGTYGAILKKYGIVEQH